MRAAGDVAADEVRVVGLVPAAVGRVPGEHDVAEPGGEALDLAPRWRRSCRASSGPARGSRPRACAGRPGPARRRRGSAGPRARTGGSGWRPAATSASAAATSRSVPAEVQAPGAAGVGVRPRHRLGQGVVDLEHARARSGSRRGGGGSRRAGRRRRCAASCRGVTSKSTARDVGHVVERVHHAGPSRSCRRAPPGAWPSRRRWPATRRVRSASRPRGPDARSIRPIAVVNGRDSGRNEWAARAGEQPARLVGGEGARRRRWPGARPAAPKPAMVSGCRGHAQQRGEHRPGPARPSARRPSRRAGPTAAPSTPRPSDGGVERPVEHAGPAVVERVGERDLRVHELEAVAREVGAPGRTATPRPAGGRPSRRRGRSPGSGELGAAACRRRWCRPPSSTSTDRPAAAHVMAAASPFGPEPTTTTSTTSSPYGVAMGVTIDEILVGDPREAWEAAGFTVDDDGTCRIGSVRVRLVGRDGGKRILGLVAARRARRPAWPTASLDGLPTTGVRRRARRRPPSTPTAPPTSTTSCCSRPTWPAPPRPSAPSASSRAASGTRTPTARRCARCSSGSAR